MAVAAKVNKKPTGKPVAFKEFSNWACSIDVRAFSALTDVGTYKIRNICFVEAMSFVVDVEA